MKTKDFLLCLYSLFFLLFLTSCNNKLSREKAESLIIAKYNLPQEETEAIDLYEQTSTKFKTSSKDDHNVPSKQGVMLFLEQEGLITYNIELISSDIDEIWWDDATGFGYGVELNDVEHLKSNGYRQEFRIDETYSHTGILTEEGTQFVSGRGFRTAKLVFGEITGIVERKDFNIAEVNYTLRRVDITPFGRALNVSEETIFRTANFTRYDDGWRINN